MVEAVELVDDPIGSGSCGISVAGKGHQGGHGQDSKMHDLVLVVVGQPQVNQL